MRDILFRGMTNDVKDEDGKPTWMQGSLFTYYGPDEGTDIYFIGDLIIELSKDGDFEVTGVEFWRVIPETIGQFVGKRDKNRMRIFEGDILGVQYDDLYPENITKCVVVFHDGVWCLKDLYDNGLMGVLEAFDVQRGEVLGNIFDNTEAGVE